MQLHSSGLAYCTVTNQAVITDFHVPFDFSDAKGRAVGCRVRIKSMTQVEREPGSGGLCKPEHLGTTYVAGVHVTRNGVEFGGSSAGSVLLTFDEAHQWVNAAIERCRKANAKKFCK